jgi:hypothetical protein
LLVGRMPLRQLRLSLAIVLVLAGATWWRLRHPARHLPRGFALRLVVSDLRKLLYALLAALIVDQTPPRCLGCHGRAVQGAILSHGQLFFDCLMQELGIAGVDVSPGTVAKRIPATARGADAEVQPPQWIGLVRVVVPWLGWRVPRRSAQSIMASMRSGR